MLLLGYSCPAQRVILKYETYLNTGKSMDQGFEISHRLQDKAWLIGAEYRSIDWGSQIALSPKYQSDFWFTRRWRFMGTGAVHLGMALFYHSPKFSPGLSYVATWRWQSKRRFFVDLSLGARYNVCPGYKKYGRYQSLEFPLGISIGWNRWKGDATDLP